jgi:hypothetical protein
LALAPVRTGHLFRVSRLREMKFYYRTGDLVSSTNIASNTVLPKVVLTILSLPFSAGADGPSSGKCS